jgi:3-deoxy-manno-octulosonate cytidylyltransferase (CMP-KDO synthetase)
MIQRVYEQARKTQEIHKIIIATDHPEIQNHVSGFGAEVVLTSPECPSGTDRCAEVLSGLSEKPEIVLNIQGDEPFIQPAQIQQLIQLMKSEKAEIGTLCKRIEDHESLFNENLVKLVKTIGGKALYFSRQAIPFQRGKEKKNWLGGFTYFRHIGLYAYRQDVLPKLTRLAMGNLEKAESLEQLRWLEAGFEIYVAETEFESNGIDTPEDLKRILQKGIFN